MTDKLFGVVGFSFGQRANEEEPNPCNANLGWGVEHNTEPYDPDAVVKVMQWEIAKYLILKKVKVDAIVTRRNATVKYSWPSNLLNRFAHKQNASKLKPRGKRGGRRYLDSEDVWRVAKQHFEPHGIKKVMLFANTEFHYGLVRKMAIRDGYEVMDIVPVFVGYDKSKRNLQWWTRSRMKFILYGGIVKLTGIHGLGQK